MVEQRDDGTGDRLDRHRAAGAAGVPMAPELHRDHLPARRQGSDQRPEIEVDGQQAPWSSTSGLPLPRISS